MILTTLRSWVTALSRVWSPLTSEGKLRAASTNRMPLCLVLGPTFGCRQRFCGFLTVARGLQVGLVAAALVDHALIFAPARGEQELPCRVQSFTETGLGGQRFRVR